MHTPQQDPARIHAPWEKAFTKIVTPFEEFIHHQSASGLLLMACALVALLLANSFLAQAYAHVLHLPLGLNIGGWELEKPLHHWINDGLMALFFFVVGLEIKREILVGELSDPRQAALPIVAAIGGMVVPALLFTVFNLGGDGIAGWGIPMATDIAFAVGVLVLLGTRVPKSLITFLVALAIVDDLGAVVVIALFYTEELQLSALGIAGLLWLVLIAFNLFGIRRALPYFIVGSLLWLAMLKSGVHATLAGVITALTIPARPQYDSERFTHHARALLDKFDAAHAPGQSIMKNDTQKSLLQALENGVHGVTTPLQRLEHNLHLPVAFLIIPIFALANAGVPLHFSDLGTTLGHPVTLGVIAGLVLGKVTGIAGASWLALKLGIGMLPRGTTMAQIVGVGLLGGIGFTMSIFIAELAYAHQPEYLVMAKTGILFASAIAGIAGYLWLLAHTQPRSKETTHEQ
ncbi:MAG: Na+/H+ antiporter NhaA [Pseudomonadota bacterium]